MIHSLFPTEIYQSRCLAPQSALFKALLSEAKKIYQSDQEGHQWSEAHYPFGYTSYGSLNSLHLVSPNFADLAKAFDLHLKKYLKELNLDVSPKQLKLKNLWLNWMEQGAHHSWHIHPHQVISGTFYLAMPRGATGIKFQDPRLPYFMNRPLVKNSSSQLGQARQSFVEVKSSPGDVVLFESWLFHEVPSQQQEAPRVSVSFNYDWG